MGYSCRTLLRDTLLRHSSGTLLRDTLVGLSSSFPFQLPRYSAHYSCTTRSPVLSFQLHRSGTGQIALSPAFCALDTHDLRRGLQAHGTNRTLACISRTRHARSPQRVARAWDKSHSRLHFAHSTRAISAEGCASSLQNERFVRDFLKNSHVKVCKTSVSYETSSKSQAETPIGAHTSRSPAKQFRDSSPSKQHPLTRHPNVTATFTSTTTHNLTIPRACHESFPIHTSNAHKVLRLLK